MGVFVGLYYLMITYRGKIYRSTSSCFTERQSLAGDTENFYLNRRKIDNLEGIESGDSFENMKNMKGSGIQKMDGGRRETATLIQFVITMLVLFSRK